MSGRNPDRSIPLASLRVEALAVAMRHPQFNAVHEFADQIVEWALGYADDPFATPSAAKVKSDE